MQAESVELEQFVAESLRQVIAGVSEAQSGLVENGAQINPNVSVDAAFRLKRLCAAGQPRLIEQVDFDVSLLASQGTGTKGGIGLFVAGAVVGAQKKVTEEVSSINRIRFSVPLVLPVAVKKEAAMPLIDINS